ncbi:hypothetical protein EHQ55_17225 [Leptospira meyeri]|nr:hypothetical protein EHQ55_17225 [Leptospira meyeri]
MKNKLLIILLLNIPFLTELMAQSQERKKIHLLVSPFGYSQTNLQNTYNNIDSSPNIHILYGITKNLYLGINYGFGLNAKQKNYSYQIGSPDTTRFFNNSKSRNSETLSLSSQYFFWYDFYGSVNFGLEKGHTFESKNYSTVSGGKIDIEPINERTIYSDRYFGSLGIGIRKEYFDCLLLGFEFQYGYIEAGKRNTHFTYNPEYYGNSVPSLLRSEFLNQIFFPNKTKNSDFYQISISAGIAI